MQYALCLFLYCKTSWEGERAPSLLWALDMRQKPPCSLIGMGVYCPGTCCLYVQSCQVDPITWQEPKIAHIYSLSPFFPDIRGEACTRAKSFLPSNLFEGRSWQKTLLFFHSCLSSSSPILILYIWRLQFFAGLSSVCRLRGCHGRIKVDVIGTDIRAIACHSDPEDPGKWRRCD